MTFITNDQATWTKKDQGSKGFKTDHHFFPARLHKCMIKAPNGLQSEQAVSKHYEFFKVYLKDENLA